MMRHKSLLLLVILSSIAVCSMADHSSSDSSDDDHKHKDEHSGDVPNEVEKGKNKEKKDGKKNGKAEEYDDNDGEAGLSDKDIDSMFGDPSDSKASEKESTTNSPPMGVFGPGFSGLFGGDHASSGKDDDPFLDSVMSGGTTVSPGKEDSKSNEDDSKNHEETKETTGNRGSPFYPTPRPVDIWDRLFVLVAFPICFFAVMLKAEMFR